MPAKATSTWPEAHDRALKVAVDAGCSFSQVALVLNDLFRSSYTRNATIGRANRLGLCRPKKPAKVAREPQRAKVPKKPSPAPQRFACDESSGLRVADVVPLNISIYELTEKTCHWPYGDGPPFVYCGCPVFDGSPYCEPHAALAQGQGTIGERNARHLPRVA